MYPTDQKMSIHTTSLKDEVDLLIPKGKRKSGIEMSEAEFALFNTKRLQSDLVSIGNKIKTHEDNMNSLKIQKNKLDESIVDLQAYMSKLSIPRNENYDNGLQGGDDGINEQILRHPNSAAGVLGWVESHHGLQASQMKLMRGVLGIVAKLGTVNDDSLSQVLSDYLGARSMLAVVCKDYETVQALERYDNQGNINRNVGLHGLGSSIGKTVEGRFEAISLDNLNPYVGQRIAGDPQRRLDLLKPKLRNGELPPGFLGFAVNMIHIDPSYMFAVTSDGHGLRETLFYSLFSRLQVYETRGDMINARPCISDGAVSLDGGIIRTAGIFTLGSRDVANVRFAKPIASRTNESYIETERQMKELIWKKEKTVEDVKREQVLREHAMFNFSKKKEEFLEFLLQM